MNLTMPGGHIGSRCQRTVLRAMMAFLLISLASIPGATGWRPSAEDAARFGSEWEKVRENQAREIRANQRRIAEMEARERGAAGDKRDPERITRDRVAALGGSVRAAGKGQALTLAAEKVAGKAEAPVELYEAQALYLDSIRAEWGRGGAERKRLREAHTALQQNFEHIDASLAMVTAAAEAASARVRQSGVLDKAKRTEEAAREAMERLAARWERQRAAQERERLEREREAGERMRGRP
jgi:hypothetical protein